MNQLIDLRKLSNILNFFNGIILLGDLNGLY